MLSPSPSCLHRFDAILDWASDIRLLLLGMRPEAPVNTTSPLPLSGTALVHPTHDRSLHAQTDRTSPPPPAPSAADERRGRACWWMVSEMKAYSGSRVGGRTVSLAVRRLKQSTRMSLLPSILEHQGASASEWDVWSHLGPCGHPW